MQRDGASAYGLPPDPALDGVGVGGYDAAAVAGLAGASPYGAPPPGGWDEGSPLGEQPGGYDAGFMAAAAASAPGAVPRKKKKKKKSSKKKKALTAHLGGGSRKRVKLTGYAGDGGGGPYLPDEKGMCRYCELWFHRKGLGPHQKACGRQWREKHGAGEFADPGPLGAAHHPW